VLILRLPRRRWSLPLVEEEKEDKYGSGALGAPLGCSALGAEQERINEQWNDLSRINLLPLGSDLIPYISR